jgi:hypothetical protein
MFYLYGTLVWAGKVGMFCTIYSAGMLCNKYLFCSHFSESDFTTAERVHLNKNSSHIDYWTEASVRINSLIFLKDGKPSFLHPSPSQNGWLIEITAVQLVWRTVEEVDFTCLHT